MTEYERYLENWQGEVDSAAQYRALSFFETDSNIKKIYESLAKTEEKHVIFWESQLQKLGRSVPERRISWRTQILIWLAKRLGPQFVLGTMMQNEQIRDQAYGKSDLSTPKKMQWDEKWHAKVLKIISKSPSEGASGFFLSRMEGRHRAVGANALRAAVLGANDGLCSNLSLVMGVAGAAVGSRTILVTGLAGLLAGAFSMALGEFISVLSSRELAEREIRIETDEVELDPEAEGEELRLIYEAKGLSPDEARNLSAHMMADKDRAIDALTREELGINPEDLGGSPWTASITSFVLFAAGAAVPVLPFAFLTGNNALLASIGFSGLGLFGLGAMITLFTGKSVWVSGSRQVLLGATAAGVTYAVGHLIGANL